MAFLEREDAEWVRPAVGDGILSPDTFPILFKLYAMCKCNNLASEAFHHAATNKVLAVHETTLQLLAHLWHLVLLLTQDSLSCKVADDLSVDGTSYT